MHEAKLHLSGCVNCHNYEFWKSWEPNNVIEYIQDSPKMEWIIVSSCNTHHKLYLLIRTLYKYHNII